MFVHSNATGEVTVDFMDMHRDFDDPFILAQYQNSWT